ncbi:MAG: LuxR C-terminal-related transcriptional regulator [Treponema sp.]|jgi:DNA-binding NarL/FixJ family response regulator|nr:LuxR C-terminal-related transcriptional regulator [Treponema sp.]
MLCRQFGCINMKGTDRGARALNWVINDYKPRLVFFEAGFYGTATPYMLRRLREEDMPGLTIAAFSLGECPLDIELRFLFYGVDRYISLRHGMADFMHGFKTILDGKAYIAQKVQKAFEDLDVIPEPSSRESDREDEVLVLLANGKRRKEIAELLDISQRTVANHRTSIFSRYQAKNVPQMIRLAQNAGKIKLNGYYCLS